MQYLRELTDADRQTLFAWRTRPEVAQYMFSDGPRSTDEHARWFAGLAGDARRRYWIIHHAGRDLGVAHLAELDSRHGRCSFGIYLADPASRGLGLGRLAEWELIEHVFGTLALEKLCCEVLATNQRMIALQQRFGFVEEGRLRRQIRKQDGWHDVLLFGLLRQEWLAGRDETASQIRELEAGLAARFPPTS